MKIIIIIGLICTLTTTCFSQQVIKTIVSGKKEQYEKTTFGRNQTYLQNMNSRFRDTNFLKGQWGVAENFSLPKNQFISRSFKKAFSEDKLLQLNNKDVTLSGIFNTNGTLEDITFYYWHDADLSVECFEKLEKELVNKYRINISPLSQPNIKYVTIVFRVKFQEVIDGSLKY